MAGPGGARRRRGLAGLFALLLAASLLCATAAQAKPPPNPTNQQLKNARAAKTALAAEAGRIAGRIARTEGELQRLNGAAQVAEQKLALARQREEQAATAAAAAKSGVAAAQHKVEQGHKKFISYVQASYVGSATDGVAGALLTAPDPNALLEQTALHAYATGHQLDAIGQLNTATVAKSNAEAVARGALDRQKKASAAAKSAQQQVLAALAQVTSQKAILDAQLVDERKKLRAAQIKLTGYTNQRVAYRAWKKQQDAIAAAKAKRLRELQLAQQHAAGSSAPAPTGGSWTPAKAQEAVRRVMPFLGVPYSFAAGNRTGPTYGVSEPGAAWNDSNIRGFDCSGLTIYAWGPWLSMDHFAATQYTQVGSYHPSINNLLPGDFVFWSGDGTIGGIGHVAIYIGGGNVIQAPQSGDVIKITNVYSVEAGYYGATRPLT